jgi:glucans biosynthesis protein
MNGIIGRCRRIFPILLILVFIGVYGAGRGAAAEVGRGVPAARVQFRDVIAKARALAEERYRAPGQNLSDVLKKMGYDQWRDIRFKPDHSLWAGEPFSVQFFHPGFLYQHPVTVHVIDRDGTRDVPFDPGLFDYASKELKSHLTDDYGFAGLRVHYPLNTPKYADELISFIGASYFRALGKDLGYGLSARGLAVNTAMASGEEFPLFREFWLIHPAPGDKSVRIFALLDSDSVTGAYEFTIYPGEETIVNVGSQLFFRQRVEKLGIAPLTSMFFYGENGSGRGEGDFRPEVHDSDGLLLHARSGEWIWHPLVDPSRLLINSFGGGVPEGFGLLQRDTAFDHYQDLEARYERRPGVWVTPRGDWGKGRLELVQIPTPSEYNDNIVAYWVPERSFSAGDSARYDYSLSWHSARNRHSVQGFVTSTMIMKKPDETVFLVDFAGDPLAGLPADKEVTPDVWISKGGRITAQQLIRNPVSGGWRLVLHVQWDDPGFLDGMLPNQRPAVEFRAFLKSGVAAVTETWSYTVLP